MLVQDVMFTHLKIYQNKTDKGVGQLTTTFCIQTGLIWYDSLFKILTQAAHSGLDVTDAVRFVANFQVQNSNIRREQEEFRCQTGGSRKLGSSICCYLCSEMERDKQVTQKLTLQNSFVYTHCTKGNT